MRTETHTEIWVRSYDEELDYLAPLNIMFSQIFNLDLLQEEAIDLVYVKIKQAGKQNGDCDPI